MTTTSAAIKYADNTVAWAEKELDLNQRQIGCAIGADRRTLYRWRRRKTAPSAQHRRNLEKLNELKYLFGTSFRSTEAAQRWLHTDVPDLRGRTPYFAIAQGDLESVLQLLGTLQAGAFR